jgi:hypothetical protein
MVAGVSESTLQKHAYYAIRVCPKATAEAWWAAVRRERDLPPAITTLLTGRTRVELTRDEAGAVMAWARRLDGWGGADPKPLHVYPPLTA